MALAFLQATLGLNLAYSAKGVANLPLAAAKDVQSLNLSQAFATGSGVNQGNLLYCAKRSLAAAATDNLLLYNGLVDNLGNTLPFAKVRAICISLLSTSLASSITIGNAASHPWAGPWSTGATEVVTNGGIYLNTNATLAGWAVGTLDQLKVLNNDGANTASYLIFLLGS